MWRQCDGNVVELKRLKDYCITIICFFFNQNRGSGGIPIQRARIDTPSVTRPRAPYDLTARMVEEPEKTLAVNGISGFQPAPATLPIPSPASNQDFVILFTPQPTIPVALPVQNTNYYLVPTPVASSVVASKAVTGISDNQQNQQQRVEPNPGTCKPSNINILIFDYCTI
jgi:hypothetical protein